MIAPWELFKCIGSVSELTTLQRIKLTWVEKENFVGPQNQSPFIVYG